MAPNQIYVGVVGAGVANPATDGPAEEVGRLLAERGAVVVCGGMTGVMEAACRGSWDLAAHVVPASSPQEAVARAFDLIS